MGFFSENSPNQKTVIFDIGNVILDITFEAITIKATGNLEKLPLYSKIFECDTWTKDACLGHINETEIIEKLMAEFDLPHEEIKALRQATRDCLIINDECVALIKKLAAQGCRLLVISNMPTETYNSFAHYDFWSHFEKIYISAHVHKIKPGKEIFEQVIKECKLDVKSTWFIDDSLKNLEEPEKLGINVCHFTTARDCEKQLMQELGLTPVEITC